MHDRHVRRAVEIEHIVRRPQRLVDVERLADRMEVQPNAGLPDGRDDPPTGRTKAVVVVPRAIECHFVRLLRPLLVRFAWLCTCQQRKPRWRRRLVAAIVPRRLDCLHVEPRALHLARQALRIHMFEAIAQQRVLDEGKTCRKQPLPCKQRRIARLVDFEDTVDGETCLGHPPRQWHFKCVDDRVFVGDHGNGIDEKLKRVGLQKRCADPQEIALHVPATFKRLSKSQQVGLILPYLHHHRCEVGVVARPDDAVIDDVQTFCGVQLRLEPQHVCPRAEIISFVFSDDHTGHQVEQIVIERNGSVGVDDQ